MSEHLSYQELLKKMPEPKLFAYEDFLTSFLFSIPLFCFLMLVGEGEALSWKGKAIGFLVCLIVIFIIVWIWGYNKRDADTYYEWEREYVVPFLNNLPKNVLIEESDIVSIGDLDADRCLVGFVLNRKLRKLNAEVEVVEVESPYITCVELEEDVYLQEKGDLLHVTLHISKEDLKKYWTA